MENQVNTLLYEPTAIVIFPKIYIFVYKQN